MMISPEGFIREYEHMNYSELIKIRNELISDIYYFENKEKMHKQLNKIINDNDTVYVKASRGCKFEDTVAYLETL